jgi:hypothetical protein
MRTKLLPLALPEPIYKRLERLADSQERDPLSQARWILLRALDSAEGQNRVEDTTGVAG